MGRLRVIDVGYTSPSNINYLTSLGQSVYMANLVHDAYDGEWKKGVDEDGNEIWDVEGFVATASSSPASYSTSFCCGPRWTTCPSRW